MRMESISSDTDEYTIFSGVGLNMKAQTRLVPKSIALSETLEIIDEMEREFKEKYGRY